MTVAVPSAAARARSAWIRVVLSADAAALASIAVFAVVVAALTWGAWGDLDGDTGHDFVAGTRFAHGDLPYVNEDYYYGPLAPALLGLAARIGGSGVGTFVAFGLAVAAAIVLATYALARTYVGPRAAFLAGAITVPVAFGVHQFSFVLPHTSAATLGTLTVLCTLLALARFARDGEVLWLAAAGAATGLAALTKPEFAGAAAAAVVLTLVMRKLAGQGRLRDAATAIAPAVAIPAAVYGAFLTKISLHRLLFENLDPRDFLHAAGNTILKSRTPFTASSFVHLGARLFVYAVGAALLLLVARAVERRGFSQRAAAAVLGVAALVAAGAAAAQPGKTQHILQLAYGWIPAGAAICALFLLVRCIRRRDRAAGAQLEIAGLAALTILAATNYNAFYPYSGAPQMATYAVPLAAVFFVRLHLVELARWRAAAALGAAWLVFVAAASAGLTLKDAHAESVSVSGPYGTLKTTPALGSAYQAAVNAVVANTRPGEPILLAPEMTWMYTLTGREDPLAQINLLPGALAGAGREQAAIARLQADRVRVAVIDRHTWPGFGQTSFGASFDQLLDRWIRTNFTRTAVYRTGSGAASPLIEIWLRRTP